jgi:hypothetical protein
VDVRLLCNQRTAPLLSCESLLEPTSSSVGKVVDNARIKALPLNTRNVYNLIFLTPGVAGTIGNSHNQVSYSINGVRGGLMETLVDGLSTDFPTVNGFHGISVFPSVDAVEEFKVQGGNYSAESGRSPGSVPNLVYKSGTTSSAARRTSSIATRRSTRTPTSTRSATSRSPISRAASTAG